MSDPRLTQQLEHCLVETRFSSLGELYRGKVRDTYRRGDRLVLVTTDRLSAFDRVLTTIPFKGEILNRLAWFWFEKTRHIAPNHAIDLPDPNVTVARACEPLPVEFVVRGYLSGSLWRDYQRGAHTAYGLALAPGMKKDQRFPVPVLTPTTKATGGEHDRPISDAEIVARGLVSARDLHEASSCALALFAEGQRWAIGRGLVLVDTKYEFGKADGKLQVIDEIHTPDSSRYWVAAEVAKRFEAGEDQRMLDKENIRQWLMRERGYQGDGPPPEIPESVRVGLSEIYLTAYQAVTGSTFELQVGDVRDRVERNLKGAGYL